MLREGGLVPRFIGFLFYRGIVGPSLDLWPDGSCSDGGAQENEFGLGSGNGLTLQFLFGTHAHARCALQTGGACGDAGALGCPKTSVAVFDLSALLVSHTGSINTFALPVGPDPVEG